MADLQGKPADNLLFRTDGNDVNTYVTKSGLSFIFVKPENKKQGLEKETVFQTTFTKARELTNEKAILCRSDMDLIGADIRKENIVKENESDDSRNFFLPHCPDGIYDVHRYQKITIRNIYPGIDWLIQSIPPGANGFSTIKGLKYSFIVHPGADPSLIQMKYKWTGQPEIHADGSLRMKTPAGTITEAQPFCFEEEGNAKVSSSFQLSVSDKSKQEQEIISFRLENYDKNKTLIIDPAVVWATYYGTAGTSASQAMTNMYVDGANEWFTGYSWGIGFPMMNPGGSAFFQDTAQYQVDLVIVKFNTTGVLLWATNYGGGNQDIGRSITSDGTFIWVTGSTQSSDFPVLNTGGGAFFQGNLNPGNGPYESDAFVLKFNTAGTLLWATYIGGKSYDVGISIHCDGTDVWLSGTSSSPDFPLLNPGAGAYFQGSLPPTTDPNLMDNAAFFLKFNIGCVLQWSTFYGGGSPVSGNQIMSDGKYVWVAGNADQKTAGLATIPTLDPGGGAYFQPIPVHNKNTPSDGIILKFSTSAVLLWATYYGGNSFDMFGSINSDGKNVWIAGVTGSTDFPTMQAGGGAYFDGALGIANSKGVILKFNTAGVREWASEYGGSGTSDLGSIASDGTNVWVSGSSHDNDFPVLNPNNGFPFYAPKPWSHDRVPVILEFNTTGIRKYATIYGTPTSFGESIGINPVSQCVFFLIGPDRGMMPAYIPAVDPGGGAWFQSVDSSGNTPFILELCKSAGILSSDINSTGISCNGICDGTASAIALGGKAPYTYLWNTSPPQTTSAINGMCPGTYSVSITDANIVSVSNTITVTASPPINASVTQTRLLCKGNKNGTATLNASGGTGNLSYTWSTIPPQTSATAIGLAAGTYSCVVSDGSGCQQTLSVILTDPSPILDSVKSTNLICSGINNGLAIVSAAGGTGPLHYSWNTNPVQTTATASGLSAGSYTCTISDSNSCTKTAFVSITAPPSIQISIAGSNLSCSQTGGSATVTASGGTGILAYSWNTVPVQTTTQASNLASGTYTCTVTDSNGCSQKQSVSIQLPLPLSISASSNAACGLNQGSAAASPSGGTLNYTYSWTPSGGSGSIASGLSSGIYTCTVTDANSCSQNTMVNVLANALPHAYAGRDTTLASGDTLTLRGSGGGTYSWSPAEGLSCTACPNPFAQPEITTTYVLTVTNAAGCSATASITLDLNCGELFVPNLFSPNGDNMNDEACIYGKCIKDMNFAIFDRWGEKVFETSDQKTCWDGTFRGNPMNSGVYAFYLKTTLFSGQNVTKKGYINLIR